MTIDHHQLMAYADGELDAPARAAVDAALRDDAALRERLAMLRAQRARITGAFAPVLDEPVPQRLAELLTAAPVARAAPAANEPALGGWARWGGMAASLLLGTVLGAAWVGEGGRSRDAGDAGEQALALAGGEVVAGASLARALDVQLAGAPAAAADPSIAVQLSFVDRTGQYCRSFTTSAAGGLACRQGPRWVVVAMASGNPPASPAGDPGALRQAASALPPAVLRAVDERVAGAVLDAAEERQARDRGWKR